MGSVFSYLLFCKSRGYSFTLAYYYMEGGLLMEEPLFHGTDKCSQENIVNNGINLNQNPRGGDFAVGFYLTPVLRSAMDMALRKSFGSSQPSIVELSLLKGFDSIISVKNFGAVTLSSSNEDIIEWAQFIVNNRNGESYIKNISSKFGLGDNNLDKRYDIVIGTIADGSVTKIARKCKAENRIITLNEAKNFLDKSFGLQYCISTKRGLSMINKPPREKKGVLWR